MTYLARYDRLKATIEERFDMPERVVETIIRFLSQNEGKLSQRARQRELSELNDEEIQFLEDHYQRIFGSS